MSSTQTADRSYDGGPSLLVHPAVIVLFLFLAGPITALQVVDVDVLVLSLLAIPGYVVLSVLAALVSLVGADGWIGATTGGTAAFYAVNVVWTYVVSVAIIAVGRAVGRRLAR